MIEVSQGKGRMEPIEPMFRALGDPTRLEIFRFLARCREPVAVDQDGSVRPFRGVTVGEICCHVTGDSKVSSTISFHLKELRLAGLITAERQGRFTICSVRPEALRRMIDLLDSLQAPQHEPA
ncbi:MAG: helix-turn-helix domain-containing protein [Fimbriimonadaceae bacterium]|nr:helix-turn-helix domain-containing protein [Fimbriimonadaceae bacterium]